MSARLAVFPMSDAVIKKASRWKRNHEMLPSSAAVI
jgi:hypothetical protein